MDRATTKASRRLSWLLRHGASEKGLNMDPAGWVNVGDVLAFLRTSENELERVVNTNSKRRFQLAPGRIRACQGHSIKNLAVTREALEASWCVYQDSRSIWHGTVAAAIAPIAHEGILPGSRTHVHCAPFPDSLVGKRDAVEVMLELSPQRISESGLTIFVAPNGVILVRHVPSDAIVSLLALSNQAKQQEATLRAYLGLDSRHVGET
ncbi:RNA:NAD 2'-phosphotransferase [uncultured Defluviicoccus sp.]|uniref:RNA:NAD 2'-phosphotransferase n=1 Tax=metagenome TaxID=256318 RepID=A0A380TI21_9ZZZZ|nr:RNA:NAD 2'-phosphotransferase [uncultured Defluviicoccus sp.]